HSERLSFPTRRSSDLRVLGGLLLVRGPGRVLLRDQAIDALRQEALGARRLRVRPGTRREQVLLVLEPFARGAVGGPVLLVLLELDRKSTRLNSSHSQI